MQLICQQLIYDLTLPIRYNYGGPLVKEHHHRSWLSYDRYRNTDVFKRMCVQYYPHLHFGYPWEVRLNMYHRWSNILIAFWATIEAVNETP